MIPVQITPIIRAEGFRTGARAERLTAYVSAAAVQRFRWGINDCAQFVAGWVAQEFDVDLLDEEMKAYRSGMAGAGLLALRGGLMQAFADRCRAAGLSETQKPVAGDVACINNGRPLLAIRTEYYWTSCGVAGITQLPLWSPLFCAFALPVEV